MSAYEKLNALRASLPAHYTGADDIERREAAVLNALYEIGAVVDQFEAFIEIHKRSSDPWNEIEERLRNVAPQLVAALEEALS